MEHEETMRAVEVGEPGGGLELVERPVPVPAAEEVRVAVQACGICHSDVFVADGSYPGISYPRIPGHEIAGRVEAVGEEIDRLSVGDRVGVGWHGDHCFDCDPCRRGAFKHCEHEEITGLTFDGGYAEYATVPATACAVIPDPLTATEAAPLLCAGVTTFNALRHSGARPGDLVAVQGIGGLGHLGLQYAHASGFETVAISQSPTKRDTALALGADHFVDATDQSPAEALADLGGARVVLATAPSSDAVESVLGGLGPDGDVVVVGVPGEPVGVEVRDLVGTRGAVRGWGSGHARDSEDALAFSALRDVTPTVETVSLADTPAAFDRMRAGDVRFRAVVEP